MKLVNTLHHIPDRHLPFSPVIHFRMQCLNGTRNISFIREFRELLYSLVSFS